MTQPAAGWWRGAVGYEVYLRSFADADGDGVGDLAGVRDRLDYLAWLGVDFLWITPFYPSPMLDHGYDVADYCGVDPAFGALEDVDGLVADAHALGLRVVVDLVPNHTSSQHPWFVAARSSRDNPYRDYYLWRDAAPGGGPPNNWASHFGGPAWTFDAATGQYWCHLFLPEQPDLNWRNPAVADEFDAVLRFWCERGIDGFRIDVAHGLAKDPEFRDNPPARRDPSLLHAGLVSEWRALEHVHDMNRPEVLDVYRRWRRVVAPYGALLLGEAYVLEPRRLAPYVRGQDGLHLAFWFAPMHLAWEPARLRSLLQDADELLQPPGHLALVQGSHDRPRPATRYGGGALGSERALAVTTLLFGLPGVPFLYQGDELGLEDVDVPPELAQDPVAVRAERPTQGRDGCRTPLPWHPGAGFGFTTAPRPWLPFGPRSDEDTVAVQRERDGSFLLRYRRLVALREELHDLADAPVEWLPSAPSVVAYRRGATIVAMNGGDEPESLDIGDGPWEVRFASRATPGTAPGASGSVVLPPAAALILTLAAGH